MIKRSGTTRLGWCLDNHHQDCPKVTAGGAVCSCDCHGGPLANLVRDFA